MPKQRGGTAKRGGGAKKTSKSPSSTPTGELSELDKSLLPEGEGVNIDNVIVYNKTFKKFDFFPVEGFPGGPSLTESSGLDVQLPLTRSDRMEEVELSFSSVIKCRGMIFMRMQRGNEQEHISGVVSLLNSELDGYDNDDERMERYKELVELYKEYNENGWKVKHRRHTKQAFPNEVRTKRGREITFASDVATLTNPKQMIRSPFREERSLQNLMGKDNDSVSRSGSISQSRPSTSGVTKTTTQKTDKPKEKEPDKEKRSESQKRPLDKDPDDLIFDDDDNADFSEIARGMKEAIQSIASSASKRQRKATPKKAEQDQKKKEKAAEQQRKKEEAAKVKADNRLKKLAEQAQKAKMKARKDKLMAEAKEIVNSLSKEQQKEARTKYKDLLENDGQQSSQQPQTEEDVHLSDIESDEGSAPVASRRKKRKPDKEQMKRINEELQEIEGDDAMNEGILEPDVASDQDEDPEQERPETRHGSNYPGSSMANVQNRTKVLFTEEEIPDKSMRQVANEVRRMNQRFDDMELFFVAKFKKMNDKLELEFGGHLRSLISTVNNISSSLQLNDDEMKFRVALAKNKLGKILPFYQFSDELDYLFSHIEIKRAFVELVRDKYRKKGKTEISIHDLGSDYVEQFMSLEFAAHLFWHGSYAKGEQRGGWDRMRVPKVLIDFFDDFVSGIATYSGPRERRTGVGANDAKTYKLNNMRRKYFNSLTKDPNKRFQYENIKNRYENKLKFYNDVKAVMLDDPCEKNTLAKEFEEHITFYCSKGTTVHDLKTKPITGINYAHLEPNPGDSFTMEDVDDLVQVLRSAGNGDANAPVDKKQAEKAAKKLQNQFREMEDAQPTLTATANVEKTTGTGNAQAGTSGTKTTRQQKGQRSKSTSKQTSKQASLAGSAAPSEDDEFAGGFSQLVKKKKDLNLGKSTTSRVIILPETVDEEENEESTAPTAQEGETETQETPATTNVTKEKSNSSSIMDKTTQQDDQSPK